MLQIRHSLLANVRGLCYTYSRGKEIVTVYTSAGRRVNSNKKSIAVRSLEQLHKYIERRDGTVKKVYLVDSENVGDLWVTHILALADQTDEVVVFYTQKSPHMGYDNIRKLLADGREVNFIKCVEGRNALDFQLVTELGYRLGSEKEEHEYIMVTNDTGFDAVVQYWKNAGKQVKRYNARFCQNQYNRMMIEIQREKLSAQLASELNQLEVVTEEVVNETAKEELTGVETETVDVEVKNEEVVLESSETETYDQTEVVEVTVQDYFESHEMEEELMLEPAPAKRGRPKKQSAKKNTNQKEKKEVVAPVAEPKVEAMSQEEDLLKELVNCIGLNNSGEIHNALTMFLGDEGKSVYQKNKGNLKEYVEKKELKLQDKFDTYCQLVFERSEQKESCPNNFSSFVYGAKDKRKNLNSFRSALQKEYGKEKGMQYYNMIKPHVKILNKLQK